MSAQIRVAVVADGVEGDVTAPTSGLWTRVSCAAELVDQVSGLDALPVLVRRRGVTATVEELADLSSRFGALVLTGFDARCVAIERGLAKAAPGLVVVHERHGLAVVALVCLRDGLRLRGRSLAGGRVVVRGAGAAAVGVVGLLRRIGVDELMVLRHGRILAAGVVDPDVPHHVWLATHTNPRRIWGGLAAAATDAVAIVDLEGGAWNVTATADVMAPDPVLVLLAPEDAARPLDSVPTGAIVGHWAPRGPDAIAGLDVIAGLVKGLATAGTSRVDDGVLEAAKTGLESSLARSNRPPLDGGSFDPDAAEAVAEMVAASARPDRPAGGLASRL